MQGSSRIEGFYKRSLVERVTAVREAASLTDDRLGQAESLPLDVADHMIENVVGVYGLPLGIATNFLINGRDYLVPMVIEEASVVAAASYAARLFRDGGGFTTGSTEPLMIGQVQLVHVPDMEQATAQILAAKAEILARCNAKDPMVVQLGGGARDVEVRPIMASPAGPFLVVHLIVDVRDAMGANLVNTMAEAVSPLLAQLSGGEARLRIISNLADRRLAWAQGTIPAASLANSLLPPPSGGMRGAMDGRAVVQAIVEAYAFAAADPYRAATHNKGIMNGIDAVVIATGNDWRAIEAGAHAYAARCGRYTSLSHWEQDQQGNLVGRLELPMAVGIVGGATRVHPLAKTALKIMGIASARELAEVITAVGLAQNLGAIRALATEGIQKGHMALHARNLAIAAGAVGEQVDRVADQMVREGQIRLDRAKEILQAL